MKIVIVGAGEVGSHLAKLLSKEEQDVILVDKDADRLAVIDSNYNLMTLCGSPTSFSVLKSAGTHKCDLFIAVTPFEDKNLTACAIAKHLGAKKTVARVDNWEFMEKKNADFFRQSGISKLIYPEYLAAQEIISSLKWPWTKSIFELQNGRLMVVGVKMNEESRLNGMKLKEVGMTQRNFHVAVIKRKNVTIIPRGDDEIELGDILYFTSTPEHLDEIREICGLDNHKIEKVIVMGGSRIAIRLVALAGDIFKFKIIEKDRARCVELCEKCPDAQIINGDARDIETLTEEGIDETDAFIAVTGSSEMNILASLTAKECGVAKTVAEVEDLQFITSADNLNISTVINKKLLASSNIFQLLLDSDESTAKFMALGDADIAEMEVKPKSKLTKGPVRSLSLNRDMTIAGLIRDGKGMLVSGNTVIEPGDRVVVFCLSGSIHKIERLFG
ncbi:MAG: Trk system potassium transporter TrkA [Paramuribaculum sp.]|nr:Trk system potassium transporter TrkA [Paramuribaculum sp.]